MAAAAAERKTLTISNAFLKHSHVKLRPALAAELTAHGVDVYTAGKLLSKSDLLKLANEYLVGRGAYVLTLPADTIESPKEKQSKKVLRNIHVHNFPCH